MLFRSLKKVEKIYEDGKNSGWVFDEQIIDDVNKNKKKKKTRNIDEENEYMKSLKSGTTDGSVKKITRTTKVLKITPGTQAKSTTPVKKTTTTKKKSVKTIKKSVKTTKK